MIPYQSLNRQRKDPGIRFELIERLVQFLQADAVPVVRELGSIGASGDLVPLATIARAITGIQGKAMVRMGGETIECREALERLELAPVALQPKEGLALVNGTSFSAAIAANAVWETRQLFAIALATQAMMLPWLSLQRWQRRPFPQPLLSSPLP